MYTPWCKFLGHPVDSTQFSLRGDWLSGLYLFGILRIPPFVNHKGMDVNSDWLADQQDERRILGHARIHKGRMKGDDPEIDTVQTPKPLDGRRAPLALLVLWRSSVIL